MYPPIFKLYILQHLELHEKKNRATISVLKIYVGMTSKIILKVLLSNLMLELKYMSIRKVKITTAILILPNAAKHWHHIDMLNKP